MLLRVLPHDNLNACMILLGALSYGKKNPDVPPYISDGKMAATVNFPYKFPWFNRKFSCVVYLIHTLRVYYAHATANLNSGYSKYGKVARVYYFCTIALRTSRAVLTRVWASRGVDLHERRVDLFSKRVITFCW